MKVTLNELRLHIQYLLEFGVDDDNRNSAGFFMDGGGNGNGGHRDKESSLMNPPPGLGGGTKEEEEEEDNVEQAKGQAGARVSARAGGETRSARTRRTH